MPLDISDINPKTARNIAEADLKTDPYHQNIKKAAQVLVSRGYVSAIYKTQWSRGLCMWEVSTIISVDPETGEISR